VSDQRNQVRIEQTQDPLCQLHSQIQDWLARRRRADKLQQYSTQLDNLDSFFPRLYQALCSELDALAGVKSTGTVYQVCREVDRRIVFLDEVWHFYAEKFDQRDDKEQLGEVIRAADEVVWSCYAGFYKSIPHASRKAAPLPYIEPMYSPKAIPRDNPAVLKNVYISSKFFQEFLEELPLPVIGLPQTCIEAPWWLVYVAHEVGHHIQHDLLEQFGLVGSFGDQLERAVVKADPKAPNPAQWKSWGEEIFADAFSVYNMGTWAVWAMTELELGDDRSMLAEKDNYPPSAVRLKLMAALASELELSGTDALRGHDPDQLAASKDKEGQDKPKITDKRGKDLREAARAQLKLVPAVAKAVKTYDDQTYGPFFSTLWTWYEHGLTAPEIIPAWTKRLLGKDDLSFTANLYGPRLATGSGVAAWSKVSALTPTQDRVDARSWLVPRLLQGIQVAREEETRSAEEKPLTKGLATDVGQRFLQASPEELGL
jgi:hypothetical protein